MPKINFNVPFFNELNEPVTQIKTDNKKAKFNPKDGSPIPHIVTDENGDVVLENIIVRDLLVKILNQSYSGDDLLQFDERVKRAKLAKKIQDNNSVNYSVAELEMIQSFSAKSASTILLGQIDELINGEEKTETTEE